MKVAIAQISSKLSRDNIDKHLEFINKAKSENCNIVIFPELSLNGYTMMDLVFEDAYEIEELEIFKKASKDIDILLGVALREKYKIYNSAVYFSDNKVINIYHKNTLPNYGLFQEARFFFAGDSVEDFKTKYANSMSVICEDLWNAKIIEKIVSIKPDIVYVLASSPARVFKNNGLSIEKKWNNILSTTAQLSGTYIVFANRVGFEDGLGFWGGSKIINPKGNIEQEASLFEETLLIGNLSKTLSKTEKYLLRINI